ncbi:ABC transporter substrate-binding protein [Jeotgalibacillus malaysiensis]|uniref:ABC transporter substrate-binding protein n=1 Tax=Jeotgalibacillus malaysiensis TaxID=1508404 RepID=UPI00384D4D0B
MTLKKLGNWIFICMISFSLIACSSEPSSSGTEETQSTGGEIRIAMNAEPPALDPHMTTATATSEVARNVFETLLTVNSKYEVQPMLAESYEQSDDGLTITFNLRKGIKFHNGKEMIAEDVIASFERWLSKSAKASVALNGATLTAKDDYTVVLQLTAPSFGVLHALAGQIQFPAVMPKEIIESAPPEGVTEFVGTGPFAFVEWKKDQYIHLEKYDDYQSLDTAPDGLAGKREALVDNLYFDVVTDGSTRVAGITTGEYQVAIWLPRDNYEQLKNTANVKTSVDLYGPHNFVFNKKEGILSDPKMRQAVNAAINSEEVMLASFTDEEFYRLDHGYMYQEQADWYSDAGKEYYNQNDTEKAKQLLEEAGYNGEPIRILASRDYDHIYNSAVVIQQQLEKAGMTVKLDVYDWATLVQKRAEPSEFDAFVTGFTTSADPTQIFALDPTWPGWTEDAKIEDLLNKINASTSQEEAQAYFDELQEYNWSEYLSHIKLGDFNLLTAYRDNVEGISYFEGLILWNTSIKQ